MIGRLLWAAVLLAIAAVTVALQVDRQSASAPELAPLVPAPLRAYAQTQMTIAAIERGDSAAMLAASEELVRRRPMPGEHLTLLAAAQTKAGELDAAAFTIQIAAQRGWRDPVAQEAVLRMALQGGDQAEAARRYAALFRRKETPDDLLSALAPQVLGEPQGAGQTTFAQIVAEAPLWYELFLQRGARVMPPATFGEVLGLALENGGLFRCDALRDSAQELAKRDAAAAERVAGQVARRCR